MHILVTGGTGYIGSHAVLALTARGHTPVLVDNLSNSSKQVLTPLQELAGCELEFVEMDVSQRDQVQTLFAVHDFQAVLHFAGLKSIGQSVQSPEIYYRNNLLSTLNLAEVSASTGVQAFVFSSTGTVYAQNDGQPFREDDPLGPINPYSRSKWMCEQILRDISQSGSGFHLANLRYFNPAGAHESGKVGEGPTGFPHNLFPFLGQLAAGRQNVLTIHGDSYPTPDGTGVRDYIHILDLVEGHVAALDYMLTQAQSITLNLGTGTGFSVREVVTAFEHASGQKFTCKTGPVRAGDVAITLANADLAHQVLNWRASRGLKQMCADHWRWQTQNPNGYGR
ncbi:MAG: UDP-glucose 4-epimerase GalE [Robiginitomaculum sp.]|nr:MAG: UDP-glucose 4-epimerase GalE [Robiginitomaculum sp.]